AEPQPVPRRHRCHARRPLRPGLPIPHCVHSRPPGHLAPSLLFPARGVEALPQIDEGFVMFKLIIGNRAYSSWSFRGWLALRASGLEFEELVVPLYNADWEQRREGDEFAPSRGKVPILWDGEAVVWDSLAIIEYGV